MLHTFASELKWQRAATCSVQQRAAINPITRTVEKAWLLFGDGPIAAAFVAPMRSPALAERLQEKEEEIDEVQVEVERSECIHVNGILELAGAAAKLQ